MRRKVQKSRKDDKKFSTQKIFSRNIKIAGFALLILIFSADAGEIYGKVYRWDTLEVVDAIVEIRNGVFQRMIAENGSYSFTVEDGNYIIIAKWRDLEVAENVTVKGKIRFDLILFPKIEFIEVEEDRSYMHYFAILTTFFILILFYYLKIKEKRRKEEKVLPEDLNLVLEIIKKEGGRITQKDLRKKLGYSEAKMSLIIADLERLGLIEKIKKGRGNIIFLKK